MSSWAASGEYDGSSPPPGMLHNSKQCGLIVPQIGIFFCVTSVACSSLYVAYALQQANNANNNKALTSHQGDLVVGGIQNYPVLLSEIILNPGGCKFVSARVIVIYMQ